MSILTIQNILANSSFLTLFITTLFYWIQLGFFTTSNSQSILVWGTQGFLWANLQLVTFLLIRWYDSHHFPLSNLYESLLFLSWSLTTGYFLVPASTQKTKFLIGAITAPSALFVNAFASFTLPENLKLATPLVPALQSNWLMMHVTMMILSYSMLILGSLFSIALLVVTGLTQGKDNNPAIATAPGLTQPLTTTWLYGKPQSPAKASASASVGASAPGKGAAATTLNALGNTEGTKEKTSPNSKPHRLGASGLQRYVRLEWARRDQLEEIIRVLDNLSYRTLGFGFPLLTVGILSGAVWANQAWGSYWSWDPKETWAFITWIIFAIYFHFRLNKKWSGQKPALVASLGFIFIWVCYLGVNLLGKGLHSYGWFS